MNKKSRQKQGTVKGTYRGILISVAIHAAAFLLAGMLVVFTVIPKKEQSFEPPKAVERPKMKLKKPKVKVKKSSRPKRSNRIVTKVNRDNMPQINLPEVGGFGDGLGDGGLGGGFDLGSIDALPSILGDEISAGNDLVGTFYSIQRDRLGRSSPACNADVHREALRNFFKSGWKPTAMSKFYQSPKKLYATMVMVPTTLSSIAPEAFGESARDSQYWLIHYKGALVYPEDITFRFVAGCDSTVAVRIDGEVVLAGQWYVYQSQIWGDIWQSSAADNRKWWMGNWTAEVGDWVTLKANEPREIEIAIGDAAGLCCLMLAIQEKGVEYEVRDGGGPRLPAFKTAYPSHDLQDVVYRDMVPGEVSLTNGPVFNDFGKDGRPSPAEVSDKQNLERMDFVESEEETAEERGVDASSPVCEIGPRTWHSPDGKTIEGEYVTCIGNQVTLKDARGRQHKLSLSRLSEEDRTYVELLNPPKLALSLSYTQEPTHAWANETRTDVIGYDMVYTGKVRQESVSEYNHDLTAEFYAIGVQNYADVYILLDRQVSSFRLNKVNGYKHDFSGKKVHLRRIEPVAWEKNDFTVRGEKMYGYMIVVRDSRGRIIARKATANWIDKAYEKLRTFPVGRYLDEDGNRRFPVGPPRAKY